MTVIGQLGANIIRGINFNFFNTQPHELSGCAHQNDF